MVPDSTVVTVTNLPHGFPVTSAVYYEDASLSVPDKPNPTLDPAQWEKGVLEGLRLAEIVCNIRKREEQNGSKED